MSTFVWYLSAILVNHSMKSTYKRFFNALYCEPNGVTFLWAYFVILSLSPQKNQQILDSSIPKESAEDNFKYAESSPSGKKTLGKGETARYEQFLLFPQCFPKTCTADM